MAPKSVTFRRHDHLVSVLFGDLLSHSYNITFSMFLYLVPIIIRNNFRIIGSIKHYSRIIGSGDTLKGVVWGVVYSIPYDWTNHVGSKR